ncbi:hypothetical protein TNCV_1395411 [Trichonephila clavipes]|nr:hypothetical protein TNCV_1395411 [Trichonephila clavipes]
MLVRLSRAPVLSGGLRRKTQLFSGTLYMAASSKTPPHQSKDPQKFKTPLQVPVFPGSSPLCHHTKKGEPPEGLVDTDIAVWGALSDAEIAALDYNNTESDEDESEELTPVTLSEAKVSLSLNKLRNFFLQNHVDADILQASFVLEKSIDKVRLNSLKQKKITDFSDKKN